MTRLQRRNFLKTSALFSLAFVSGSVSPRTYAANERITLALIGCGQQGKNFFKDVHAVCDVDQGLLKKAAEIVGVSEQNAVTDMRIFFDRKDIDAVVMVTPDHWHTPGAILAADAGKHIYLEKPAAQNFREIGLLRKAIERNKVVFQHGTHSRSSDLIAGTIQLLREGVIGEVLACKAWNVQKRGNIGRRTPSAVPVGVDYDTWVGPAEMVPFQSNRFHYNWRWWYNFGSGDVGNDGAHEVDMARWGLGVQGFPDKIAASGGMFYFDDDQEFPDTATAVFEWDGGAVGKRKQLTFEMRLWSTNYPYNTDSGVEFYGTKGQIYVSKRGKFQMLNDKNARVDEIKPTLKVGSTHVEDFLQSIRNPARPTRANINEAADTTALLTLTNAALRCGKALDFDKKTETCPSDEANKCLGRTYRKEGHWSVPKIS